MTRVKLVSSELSIIAGQKCIVTCARKPIAGFKIRTNTPVGLVVSLQRERIYAFLDRIVNLRLPRIRDFHGIKLGKLDGKGNYNFGFKEQLIFPEIQYEQIDQLRGMNVSIVINFLSNKERFSLLKRLGIPFRIEFSIHLFLLKK